jgi:hypothetical protein
MTNNRMYISLIHGRTARFVCCLVTAASHGGHEAAACESGFRACAAPQPKALAGSSDSSVAHFAFVCLSATWRVSQVARMLRTKPQHVRLVVMGQELLSDAAMLRERGLWDGGLVMCTVSPVANSFSAPSPEAAAAALAASPAHLLAETVGHWP